jgi:hypothetical protein
VKITTKHGYSTKQKKAKPCYHKSWLKSPQNDCKMGPKPSDFMVKMVSFKITRRWLKSLQNEWKMAPKTPGFMVEMDSMIL